MATYEYLGNGAPDGTILGQTSSEKIGFYGTAPIAQRSGAMQATSLVGTASSADFTTDVKAAVLELMNTMIALGLWKGST